jgi:hypothetical protein
MRKIFCLALALFTTQVFALESPWLQSRIMTNLPAKMPASGTSNTVSSAHIRPGRATGIFVSCVGTNNATNAMTLVFRGSIDNVVSNSFPLFTLAPSIIGTNRTTYYTNLTLQALPFIHLTAITNGATGVAGLTVTIVTDK